MEMQDSLEQEEDFEDFHLLISELTAQPQQWDAWVLRAHGVWAAVAGQTHGPGRGVGPDSHGQLSFGKDDKRVE